MRVFVEFEDVRLPLDVKQGQTVGDVKKVLREQFKLNSSHVEEKILQLTYAGAVLHDSWVCSDIGINSGAIVKSALVDSDKPIINLDCSFNGEVIPIREQFNLRTTKIDELRSIVSQKIGLPVSVFRLCLPSGKQLFDTHTLDDYDVKQGDTIKLYVWDGWCELLAAALKGHTKKVLRNAAVDETISRYQFRVACYIAAHFGYNDLANSMINSKLGATKPEEPVGEHPMKLWSKDSSHIDSWKCPVHQAVLKGNVNVLRIFVQNNLCCLAAKDGEGMTPMQIAIKHEQLPCVNYLASKLYSSHTENNVTLPVSILIKVRKWAERARESVIINQGAFASSVRRRPYKAVSVVGNGVLVDGFGKSRMQSRHSSRSETVLNGSTTPRHVTLPSPKLSPRRTKFQRRSMTEPPRSTTPLDSSPLPKLSTSGNDDQESGSYIQTPRTPRNPESHQRHPSQSTPHMLRTPQLQQSNGLPSIMKTKKRSSRRSSRPVVRRANIIEGVLSLPAVSVENTLRPFFYVSSRIVNPIAATLDTFQKYRDISARESSINCMIVASTFKDKAWLRQVDMAVSLAKRNVHNSLHRAREEEDRATRGLPTVAASPIKVPKRKKIVQQAFIMRSNRTAFKNLQKAFG